MSSRLLNFFQSFSISCRPLEGGFEALRSKRFLNVHPFLGKCKPALQEFCVFFGGGPASGEIMSALKTILRCAERGGKKPLSGEKNEPPQNYEYYEYYGYCARLVLVCASPATANLRLRAAAPRERSDRCRAESKPTFGPDAAAVRFARFLRARREAPSPERPCHRFRHAQESGLLHHWPIRTACDTQRHVRRPASGPEVLPSARGAFATLEVVLVCASPTNAKNVAANTTAGAQHTYTPWLIMPIRPVGQSPVTPICADRRRAGSPENATQAAAFCGISMSFFACRLEIL